MTKLNLLILGLLLLPNSGWVKDIPRQKANKDKEQMIYLMPGDRGYEVVEQCTRTVYYPDVFWRVTDAQVTAIESKLKRHLEILKKAKADFIPEPLENYKRQFIGFDLNGQSYYYANYWPKKAELEVDPTRRGVVSCRADKRYWGMLFNIDTFKFEAIERNDRLVKPKGAVDPKSMEGDDPFNG
ncbi:MAG: hypothetical protein V2I33_13555 [Kangiellaceae bacterium]|jgi:hypothetical protein|nr:hypothetical protein [Kangiellaceae bacterium]